MMKVFLSLGIAVSFFSTSPPVNAALKEPPPQTTDQQQKKIRTNQQTKIINESKNEIKRNPALHKTEPIDLKPDPNQKRIRTNQSTKVIKNEPVNPYLTKTKRFDPRYAPQQHDEDKPLTKQDYEQMKANRAKQQTQTIEKKEAIVLENETKMNPALHKMKPIDPRVVPQEPAAKPQSVKEMEKRKMENIAH